MEQINFEGAKIYAKSLLNLIEELGGFGVGKQRITEAIGKLPQMFKNFKIVLEKIADGKIKTEIELAIFMQENKITNVSKEVYKSFPRYEIIFSKMVEKEKAANKLNLSISMKWRECVSRIIGDAKGSTIIRKFLAYYECYVHSGVEKEIIKYPLLIRRSPKDAAIEVFMGNENTDYSYEGVALDVGTDIMTFSLYDNYRKPNELVQINLETRYEPNFIFLKGSFVSLNQDRTPLCGRIVLKRINSVIELDEFKMKKFSKINYSINRENTAGIDPEILYYLKDEIQSVLKFKGINPYHDGLVIAKNIIRDQYKGFKDFGLRIEPEKSYPAYSRKQEGYNKRFTIQGIWVVDFIGRYEHAIEVYYIKQSGTDVTCMFQHFKKGDKNKNLRGQGVGYCEGNKITISYRMLDQSISTNGSFVLVSKDGNDRYPWSKLEGNFFEIDDNKILTSHSRVLTFRLFRDKLSDDEKRKLWLNEEFIFNDYDEVATVFGVTQDEPSETQKNTCNYILDLNLLN